MTTPLSQLQENRNAVQTVPTQDYAVDMFTDKGFALANRIAKAYASSDAVPSQFRLVNIKRQKVNGVYTEVPVDNHAAIANCLVAIEVARAVGMSITAVMQNADMIEGKLRWSGKFVIAAINASGRFSPLRFQVKNLGPIKATFKEKGTWNRDENRYNMVEKTVEVDNIQCIAWALPKGCPEPRATPQQMVEFRGRQLDLYRELGAPVIESAPVTMRMVVEEGWYAKAGSKWQTEMRELMFQYRAGSFFGNIHAPDIVMGMGRTAEEERDIMTIDVSPAGEVMSVTPEQLRGAAGSRPPLAERVEDAMPTKTAAQQADPETGELKQGAAGQAEGAAAGGQPAEAEFDPQPYVKRMEQATDTDSLDLIAEELRTVQCSDQQYQTLVDFYQARRDALKAAPPAEPDPKPAAAAQPTTGTTRRRSSGTTGNSSVE